MDRDAIERRVRELMELTSLDEVDATAAALMEAGEIAGDTIELDAEGNPVGPRFD